MSDDYYHLTKKPIRSIRTWQWSLCGKVAWRRRHDQKLCQECERLANAREEKKR